MNKNKLFKKSFDKKSRPTGFLIDHENIFCLVKIGLCNIKLNLSHQDESNMYKELIYHSFFFQLKTQNHQIIWISFTSS